MNPYYPDREIELIPNQKELSEPFFSSQEEYEIWRQKFCDIVAPEMKQHARARAESEREAFFGRPRRLAA
jgi:hypothetical protein